MVLLLTHLINPILFSFIFQKTAGISLVNGIYGNVSNEGHRKVHFYKKIFGKNLISSLFFHLLEILMTDFIQLINFYKLVV